MPDDSRIREIVNSNYSSRSPALTYTSLMVAQELQNRYITWIQQLDALQTSNADAG